MLPKALSCATLVMCLLLAACQTAERVPARLGLKLAPNALGTSVSVQQHLKVERGGRIDELDAALEVDDQHVRLVGLAFGQRVLTLDYDGVSLKVWRHLMLPSQVKGDDVLEDVQLALWPLESIRAALPAGWQVSDEGLERHLTLNGEPVMRITYSAMPRWTGTIVLDNQRYKYRLTIQSET
jgi:hypothetical protein